MKQVRRKLGPIALSLMVAALLTGCNSSDSPPSAASPPAEGAVEEDEAQLDSLDPLLADRYEGEAIAAKDLPAIPPLFDNKGDLPNRLVPVEGVHAELEPGVEAQVYRFESPKFASAGAAALLTKAGAAGPVSGCGKNVYFTTKPTSPESEQWIEWVHSSLAMTDRGCKRGATFQVIE